MTHCSFSTVRERDMDLLFLEAIASDPAFGQFVLKKTKYADKDFSVLDVQLSRTELDLGESDITVIMEIEGQRVALLIEDKVDAIAMPDQYERYRKRGEKGLESGEWQDFQIFIFCPQKYYKHNNEAKKYNRFLSYEECIEYFKTKNDILSNIRIQQLSQAINKTKKPAETNVDKAANAFFNEYLKFQQEYYPMLDMRTSETSSGWWPHYGTRLGNVYLYHQMQEGFVVLIFPNALDQVNILQDLAAWLRNHGMPKVIAKRTGKSAALSIKVPELKVKEPFEKTDKDKLNECLDAVQALSGFADMVASAHSISAIKKKRAK